MILRYCASGSRSKLVRYLLIMLSILTGNIDRLSRNRLLPVYFLRYVTSRGFYIWPFARIAAFLTKRIDSCERLISLHVYPGIPRLEKPPLSRRRDQQYQFRFNGKTIATRRAEFAGDLRELRSA